MALGVPECDQALRPSLHWRALPIGFGCLAPPIITFDRPSSDLVNRVARASPAALVDTLLHTTTNHLSTTTLNDRSTV